MSSSLQGDKNPMYGKPPSRGAGRGISGYYKSYYFRSTFEYYAIKYFEDNDIPFEEIDRLGKSKIRVILENNKTYRPDFLINGNTIVEVKPSGLLNNKTVQHKKKQCEKQYPEYNYIFMTENDLNIDKNIIINDYKNGKVVIDKGKLEKFKRIFELT